MPSISGSVCSRGPPHSDTHLSRSSQRRISPLVHGFTHVELGISNDHIVVSHSTSLIAALKANILLLALINIHIYPTTSPAPSSCLLPSLHRAPDSHRGPRTSPPSHPFRLHAQHALVTDVPAFRSWSTDRGWGNEVHSRIPSRLSLVRHLR